MRTNKQGIVELQSNETNVILQLNKVLVVDNLGFNLLSSSQLMSKGIHLECTADSDGIVAFAPWTHPPDLDPNFSPGGFWYSRTIPEAERTNALAVLQTQEPTHESVPLIETTTTTEAVPSTTEPVVEEPPVVAEPPSETPQPDPSIVPPPPPIIDTPPTAAQQLTPAPRAVHRSAATHAAFFANADFYQRSVGHSASEDIWHQHRNTWKIVPASLPQDRPILSGKWVFRIKTNSDGTIERFKARWVVRGFDQEFGRDFTETFAPVSRHTSLRILLAVAASRRLPLRQIDVTNAFLYAPVDVNIFVEQPHGFVDDPSLVCQLLKSLYGIKQAPRLWQQYLHARLKRIGFDQLPHDQGMYRLTRDNDYVLLIVYIDDLLYIGSTTAIVTWFEKELQTDLSLTVSPDVTQYLGLNILDEDNAIHLSASKYA
ncbi:unnamed protein product, partial [Closterium sp. NIES-54]